MIRVIIVQNQNVSNKDVPMGAVGANVTKKNMGKFVLKGCCFC